MRPANKDFAAAYLLLVIIPVLILAGVLRTGSKLVAPTAIGGFWKMQVNAPGLAALPCARSLETARDAGFTISQSGKYITLTFANPAMPSTSGYIERTILKVNILPSAKGIQEAGCSGGQVFSLIATLDSQTNPNSMAGALSANDCAVCSPVEFRAERKK